MRLQSKIIERECNSRRVERPLTADHYEIEGVVAKEEGVVVLVISWAFVCFILCNPKNQRETEAVILFLRYSCCNFILAVLMSYYINFESERYRYN